MTFKKCGAWICFVLILTILAACTDSAGNACSHTFGELIPAQPGSFFAEGTVAHYQCGLCGSFFDAQQSPLKSVAAPRRSTALTLFANGQPIALELTQKSPSQILWQTEPLDLAVGDRLILKDASGGQLDFTPSDPNRLQDGIVQVPGLQAVLTFTATPEGLTLAFADSRYPGTVVQINDTEYPMTQVSSRGYSFGYILLAAGDRIRIADNLTGTVYGYDHRTDDSLPEEYNYHRGQEGECILDADGRYRLELLDGQLRITKVFAPRADGDFRIVSSGTAQAVEMECLPCPEGSLPAAFALEVGTQNAEDIAAFIQQAGMEVYSAVVHLEDGAQFRIENAEGVIPSNRLTGVAQCTVLPDPASSSISAPEGGTYWIRYYPSTDSISVTRLSSGGLSEAAKAFDLRIAAIPSYAEADYADQIKALYAEYSTLPASFRWRLKISAKLETLHRNLQKAESAAVVYHMATPGGAVYADKETLFRAFYTDFYYYIAAYHGTEQLKQYKIANASDFLILAKDFDGRDMPNLYAIGYIAGRYFLTYDTNGILDNQSDKGFLGFCHKNGMYNELLPFLQRFFAYWRIDEGYANSTNPGADLFAEAWAPTVDIAKFFYYDENTSYVRTDRALDCFVGVACVAYGFDGSDPLPQLRLRGYVFEGWYDNPEFTGEPLSQPGGQQHLYAKWSPDKAQQGKDAAALVDVYIYNLTTDRARVNATTVGYALSMYEALSPEAKAMVTRYSTLEAYKNRYP